MSQHTLGSHPSLAAAPNRKKPLGVLGCFGFRRAGAFAIAPPASDVQSVLDSGRFSVRSPKRMRKGVAGR